MELKKLKEIASVMRDNDLTLLELKEGETTLRMERKAAQAAELASATLQPPAAVQPGAQEPAPPQQAEGTEIKSPMVGVFYSAPSPDSEPYVQVGSKVKKGDTLCIIEAMKLLNEITADRDGEITEICAAAGQVVEYGQTLFRMK
ncbi:acetyl-CoA carboxylase biotin carboxyl carrier protein [Caproiciproducens galactitolivorans]|uniref:Biotin carboxyl carrier protein of acetyl-CoA carboxylase n=1 Tax=Caproiciproducens galactitolivorans TaxID=642589 RepID=A0A4Z0YJ96_9FIRM|nr:acetyl-CoA carboxylase biotin carboxyl carrier protein [Caproiciproducens galactitolivorans]QEY35258.1 acetyl-CoA carboxylase biotin carboxyl carrier protein [Caproiciproducens galactitolivorans]TGJ76952.1 biotin carboxyl carrier protein of acetyl-CoA carboxylase [Caproiciproducens galactitolivorans]